MIKMLRILVIKIMIATEMIIKTMTKNMIMMIIIVITIMIRQ